MDLQNSYCKSIFKNGSSEPDSKAYTELWAQLINSSLKMQYALAPKEERT